MEGDSFQLFNFASQSGDWPSALLSGSDVETLTSIANGTWSGETSGTSLKYETSSGVLSMIPEPNTLAFIVLASGSLFLLRRKKS